MRAVKEQERDKRLTFPLFLGILTCSDYAWKMERCGEGGFLKLEADVAGAGAKSWVMQSDLT